MEAPGPICPHCEYDLTGLDKTVCPECGNPFDPDAVFSIVPWSRRRLLGRWTAFWRTFHMAVFRPGEIAMESSRLVPPMIKTCDSFVSTVAAIAAAGTIALAWVYAILMKSEISGKLMLGLVALSTLVFGLCRHFLVCYADFFPSQSLDMVIRPIFARRRSVIRYGCAPAVLAPVLAAPFLVLSIRWPNLLHALWLVGLIVLCAWIICSIRIRSALEPIALWSMTLQVLWQIGRFTLMSLVYQLMGWGAFFLMLLLTSPAGF